MQKMFSLFLGIVFFIFGGCTSENSYNGISTETKKFSGPQWEYLQIKLNGKEEIEYSNKKFENNIDELNYLGKEGWELVSTYPIVETVFPNFGNNNYHTGIKSNIRTTEIIYIFKRKINN